MANCIVVVIGTGHDEDEARAKAQASLRARMRAELERRDAEVAPGERVHDWRAADRELDELVPELVSGDAVEVRGATIVAARLSGDDFEAALAKTREAGRRAPLRVACVPLTVLGGETRLYEARELYGAALREALGASGFEVVSTDEIYGALEAVKTLDAAGVAQLARALKAEAVVCGTVSVKGESARLELVLRDRGGIVLGRFDGAINPDEATAVARRQALVLRQGLGLAP